MRYFQMNNIKIFKFFVAVLCYSSGIMANDTFLVTSDEWSRPRNANYVLQLPAVNAVVKQWITDRDKNIEIRYPGGEEGVLWAGELKDWMVALGIPGDAITLQPGFGEVDKLGLELITPY